MREILEHPSKHPLKWTSTQVDIHSSGHPLKILSYSIIIQPLLQSKVLFQFQAKSRNVGALHYSTRRMLVVENYQTKKKNIHSY